MSQQELKIKKYKKKSQIQEVLKRMKKNRSAMVGLALLCILVLFAIFADIITNYEAMAIHQNMSERLQTPNWGHWFGTDAFGRDVFARIIHGIRVSLMIGLLTTGVSIIIGCMLGAIAGYYGGLLDSIIMRIIDTILCIPPILLALAIVASLGPGIFNLIIAMTVSSVPGFTRVIRSAVLLVVGQEFVEAAKASGTRDLRIILRHILPNAMGPIIVQGTMAVGMMIINTASLSFLGMGIQPPRPEWGAMLAESKEYIRHAPYLVIIPGLTIVLTALSLNLLGDGLRDALDPRLKD